MQRVKPLFRVLGRVLGLALAGAAVLLATALLGLWLWLQSEGSLQQSLRLVHVLLPAGQSLQTTAVSGSLRDGGRVEQLLWKKDGLAVAVQGLEVAWDWHALLNGELRVATLHAQSVQVEDRGPAGKAGITELQLPLHADLLFVIDRLEWAGPPALLLEQVRGHYRFDGTTHLLQDASLQMANGRYSGQARLQASAPMAVSLQVDGTVQTPLQLQQTPLGLVASATARGTLLGKDALVDLALSLRPKDTSKGRPLAAMQARLQARLQPGRDQPVASGQAQWTALDLASLWPQAPQTSLSGEAAVLPDGAGWKATVQVQNAAPGTLDRHLLPLRSARASVLYRKGQWQLSALQAALAGGTLQAQGSYGGSPAQWSVRGTLQGIEPAQIDTRWQFAPLQGTLSAQDSSHGIAFETQLSATLRGKSPGAMQDASLQAKGHWSAPQLQLDTLELRIAQASISGQLQINTQSYAASGHVRASLPGAEATLDGNAGPTAGLGDSVWHVTDAHALQQWLAGLPQPGPAVKDRDLAGVAELTAHWSGGWQHGGEALQIQALLQSQHMDVQAQYLLRDVRLELAGTLRALTLQLRSKAQLGATQFALQAQGHGGQAGTGQWQGLLDTLQLSATDPQHSVPWTLQLEQPVALDWRSSALVRSFSLAQGRVQLRGPAAGTAQVLWQPLQWSQQGASAQATSTRWSSKGQLQGLPLAWLELLGQTRLANLGLRGDLLLGGQWDAGSEGQGLHLRAGMQRSSGDLQLLAAEQASGALPAGLREARVEIDVVNDALHASLVWASEAAGTAQADFSTRLQTRAGSTTWPADAPLQAKLHASLPRVGIWSLVAPVGWRIQGTLQADATLSGTRSKPDWKGSLEARDMAVRSVVDGIDFSQGVMRLQIDGQHLEIAELTLLGAGGTAGGRLQISGAADWLPGAPGSTIANRLRMALEAKAQGFRVSARPDQRLVVSGNLNAKLNDAKLVLRGALVADQALFVLPEDTAPKLGADVEVKRPRAAADKAKPTATAPAPRLAQTVVPDISVTLDPGSNFQLQGHGIQTRLAGMLTLKAEGPRAVPRLTGELRTVNGTYRAYGQRLNIENGTLRFAGAYDNPSLDILALRPNLPQVVGVQVSGTAQLPVVRLYSDPDLPDADKLSWLVLGRASSNGGAETAMLQQAAMALLSGNGGKTPVTGLVNAFGLDEVSLGQAATTNADGSTGSEATVKLGKRISSNFYVAFERSLAGTLGTFYVFYDLSRRLTLRAESGAQSAVDLIFTTRFD